MNRKSLGFLAKLGVTLALLTLVIQKIDFSTLLVSLAQCDFKILLLSLLVGILASIMQALRWKVIIGDPDIRFIKYLHFIYVGYFFRAFLPGSLTADFAKIYLFSKKYKIKMIQSGLLPLSQIMGIVFQWGIGFTGFLIYRKSFDLQKISGYLTFNWQSLGLFFLAALLAFAIYFYFRKNGKLMDNIKIIRSSLNNKPKIILIAGITFVLQLLALALIYFNALSVGIRIEFLLLCAGMAIINTILVLPISISGIGVSEFFSLLLFTELLPFSKEKFISTSIISYGIILLFAVLGGGWFLLRKIQEKPTDKFIDPTPV